MIRRAIWFVALAIAVAAVPPAVAQPSSQGPWPLVDVRVEGASRYTVEDVVRLSGLTIGEALTLDRLQTVINRLAGTGLFKMVGGGYASVADGLVITLRIEEPEWSVPLVFDNNIWLGDDEFTRAMAERVPAFDNTAVEGGVANDFIAAAAERVLADRGVKARADFVVRFDVRTQTTTSALVMRDTTESLRLCGIDVVGAKALPGRLVDELTGPLVGRDFSKLALADVVATLRDEYRQRGFWRATVAMPPPSPVTGACTGQSVALAVSEGSVYAFAGARWIDATALSTADLDKALNMRIGSAADGRRLSSGLAAIERLYHARGYATVDNGVKVEFDDAAHTVTFVIQMREGPQFVMGALSTTGLSERQADDLTRRWRLKPGEVFDGVYYQQFLREQSQRSGGGLRGEAKLDNDAATVDVTFSFGG